MRLWTVFTAWMGLGVVAVMWAKGPAYTTEEQAQEADEHFSLLGEYQAEVGTVQLLPTGNDGEWLAVLIPGSLDDFWEGSTKPELQRGSLDEVWTFPSGAKLMIQEGKIMLDHGGEISVLEKFERGSPTLGAAVPEGAVVLFDGSEGSLKNWKGGKLDGEFLVEGASTTQQFGDFQLHLEFRQPYKPATLLGNQDRGNSGLYIYNRYETQVLDSFGAHFYHQPVEDWAEEFTSILGFENPSDRTQWCGAFYKKFHPRVNACLPPLTWQTYDIDFTAPKFEGDTKVSNARATVRLNGVVIQDDVELDGGTGAGGKRPEIPEGALFLQNHGNPVRYRNIWIAPKS